MDLKFSFGGASPDHNDHGDAPSRTPLPLSTTPLGATSSVLEVRARLQRSATEHTDHIVLAEALSGDGVVYTSAEVRADVEDGRSLARSVRSAVSRAVAALEGPMAESVSALVFELNGAEAEVLSHLGVAGDSTVTADLQRRVGVAAGTPIRIGA